MKQPERINEQFESREYSFEEGVKESISRILDLLKNHGSVIVAVIGGSFDAGKTTVSSRLGRGLMENGTRIKWCGSIDTLEFKSEFPESGEVLILTAEDVYTRDSAIEVKAKKFGLPFSKIDLRVFVYRPDRAFEIREKRLADILIRNERAVDKKR
ncbi:MAG: hypothetical protein PHW15_01205 [Patescibacteria group bacterium]|jgi:hypothetical protein|nr:hypothetical protein [Patescibacteria group bacterium]MDD5172569.1 hypothetical protein [Patescibacteria group bacterium]